MKPLPIRSYRQRRRRRTVVVLVVLGVLVIVGHVVFFASSSSSTTPPAKSDVAVSPPMLVGVVTEIGDGSAVGNAADVSLIDLSKGEGARQRTIGVGTFPDAVAVASDHMAYVTNYKSNSVTPIDLSTGKVKRSIPAGNGPADIAITPNGKIAYVTDAGYNSLGNTVTEIDLANGKAVRHIAVGKGPQGIAITPNGKMAYVANAGSFVSGQPGSIIGHTVTPIDLQTGRALTSIAVGNLPTAIAISTDGSTAFVANSDSGSVSPIAIAANIAGTPIQVSGTPQAIVSDGSQMIVADAESTGVGNVTMISVAGQSAGTAISVPANPSAIAVTPDAKTAWLVANGTDTLVSIDVSSGVVNSAGAINVVNGPYALALADVPSNFAKTIFPSHRLPKKS